MQLDRPIEELREGSRVSHVRSDWLVRTGPLPRRLRQDVSQPQDRNRVEHDRDDDFVSPRLSLQDTRDASVRSARDNCRSHSDEGVNNRRKVHREAHPHGRECTNDHLAFTTDVEQSRTEAERETQTRNNQRNPKEHRVCQRLNRAHERRRLRVHDGPAEHRVVGVCDGSPRSGNQDRSDREGNQD